MRSVSYEPFGPATGLTYGNGVTGSYGYDLDYRPTTRVDSGSSAIQNLAYGYYANNSVNTVTDSVSAANSQTLTYDALDRLSSASFKSASFRKMAIFSPHKKPVLYYSCQNDLANPAIEIRER